MEFVLLGPELPDLLAEELIGRVRESPS